MKRLSIILWPVLVCALYMQGQNAQRADDLFQKQQYEAAAGQYAALLKKQPQQVLYLYRYARCMQELGEAEVAIDYFLRAGEKYPLRNFYLGELYFAQYDFEEAADYYEAYIATIDPAHDRYAHTERQIAAAKKAERYIRRVEDIVILDSVVLPKNEFLSAYTLSAEAGTLTMKDGKVEYLNQRKDRRYFAVNDHTGHGSLVTCQRLLNSWAECDTLPENVNSTENENFPFVLSDGITLYFGSERKEGLGGYDIWFTQYNSETDTWVTPENAGMPFNSFRNDYMLAIDESVNIGWFATDRRCADSLVVVYKFVPNAEKKVLRDEPADYVRDAAQLKRFRMSDNSVPAGNVPSNESPKEPVTDVTSTICFPLSDSVVYTAFSDFRSYDARVLYGNYLKNKEKYANEEQRLERLRGQYAQAAGNKETLAAEIRSLEESLPVQKQNLKTQLNKIYSLELNARK